MSLPKSMLAVVVLTLLATGDSLAAAPNASRPNILFLLADDHCYETIRAFGHINIETPHLDRLAQRSTTFTRASWSGAVCVASRTMLFTGRSVGDLADDPRQGAANPNCFGDWLHYKENWVTNSIWAPRCHSANPAERRYPEVATRWKKMLGASRVDSPELPLAAQHKMKVAYT